MKAKSYTDQFFNQVSDQDDDEITEQKGSIPFVYDPTNNDFNSSMDNVKLKQRELKYCNQCNLPKPLRSHHCSVCNKCVLKMDHHCPWINSCVGFYNHRYFLLYLFWLWIGVLFGSLTSLPIYFIEEKIQIENQMSSFHRVVQPLNFTLFVLMGVFSYWNWHLALKGQTSIEFWGLRTPNSSGEKFDFSKEDIFENLKVIFGDFKHFYEIFLPSVRNLKQNGVIWENNEGEETQALASELSSLDLEEL